MKMRLLMAGALLSVCAAITWAQQGHPTPITLPPSSVVNPAEAGVRAFTNVQILGSGAIRGVPAYYGPPYGGLFYETPASVACIYGFEAAAPGCDPFAASRNPNGGSRAIAVVDAYDDPYIYRDLEDFSGQFGVGAINPTSFMVVYAPPGDLTQPGVCDGSVPGPEPPYAGTTGWDLEESLDVEWAHAMAPLATLYLVEAQSDYFSDLLCAVTVASNLVKQAGGGEVSMSWGSPEWPEETSLDFLFTTPKVVYFAAAGDGPGVIYPAASPNIVAVGGTSLRTNATTGAFIAEATWPDTGGGPSAYEARPSYQSSIASIVGTQRGTPDVAADGNPFTGVWVLDTLVYGPGTWWIVGGTSVATPLWSGVVNAAGRFAVSTRAELTKMYDDKSGFGKITYGNCGLYSDDFASEGWNFCRGLGSPSGYSGK